MAIWKGGNCVLCAVAGPGKLIIGCSICCRKYQERLQLRLLKMRDIVRCPYVCADCVHRYSHAETWGLLVRFHNTDTVYGYSAGRIGFL